MVNSIDSCSSCASHTHTLLPVQGKLPVLFFTQTSLLGAVQCLLDIHAMERSSVLLDTKVGRSRRHTGFLVCHCPSTCSRFRNALLLSPGVFEYRFLLIFLCHLGPHMNRVSAGHTCLWQIQCSSSYQPPCLVQGRNTIYLRQIQCSSSIISFLVWCRLAMPYTFGRPSLLLHTSLLVWCRDATLHIFLADPVFFFTPASLSGAGTQHDMLASQATPSRTCQVCHAGRPSPV